ncbi:hypothetical protein SLEP1_g4990 [Rubroshorea leprosula]|uniref:DUF4219 domain-containing protein n=1 Tax=Rubroshorea leprosula TaxID=152421 RepID=A0AAV5HYC0_9ROSI|nr:hypothetical protein SLEP1_g4990 [Rubroshorea leprosula]
MAMKNTSSATMIVPQLLESGNYKSWSIFMEDYLISQELWDGIIVPFGADQQLFSESERRKRNAAALNAIKISCGPESFVRIKYTRSAKDALDMLAKMHKTEPETDESTPKARLAFSFSFCTPPFFGDINSASMIVPVPELLASDNYKRWSICMKSYLVSQDLWDAVVHSCAPAGVDTKEWIKKDAAALHAIQISCGPKKFDVIEEISSAKTAWNTLKQKHIEKHPEDGPPPALIDFLEEKGFRTMERPQSLIVQDAIDKGNVNAVMGFFKSNPGVEKLALWTGLPPLHHATIVGKSNIVKALFENMPAVQKDLWDNTALTHAAQVDHGDLASFLLPFLGIKQIYALKLSHGFARASLCLIYQHLTKLHLRKFEDTIALRKALTRVIENDIYDFLTEMVETNADLLFAPVPNDETTSDNLLMDATAFRREKIARLLIGLPHCKVFINAVDSQQNTILHMAGKLASDSQLSRISGAALQMQREIQWFKEVESLLSQRYKDSKNKNGETAYQVLAREHKALLKEAEDWMKGLANSYIIVGALIITIMFAAAFTLPGAASVIIFLGFLTSRYNMKDFHTPVPKKLMAGLSTLFVSLAAMMIAFCSAIFLMLENRWWIIIPSVLLAGIPVGLFAWLQFPLLVEIYVLTYRSAIFSEKRSLASKIKAFFSGKKKIE